MKYGLSLLSIIPMRKEPGEQSEMVSQLLFGESYKVTGESNNFAEIVTEYDQYKGWIDKTMHHEITEDDFLYLQNEQQSIQAAVLMGLENNGQEIRITAGSTLPGYDKEKGTLSIEGNIYRIKWSFGDFESTALHCIDKTALQFLNTPYLWGGRSIFGCDCSGFVQTVFKIHGIKLKRDAGEQALYGTPVDITNIKKGDLAFFVNDKHRDMPWHVPTHVGMIIAPGEIIHSSGYVHIDRLDEKGIFNLQRKQYTHPLHSIRRYL